MNRGKPGNTGRKAADSGDRRTANAHRPMLTRSESSPVLKSSEATRMNIQRRPPEVGDLQAAKRALKKPQVNQQSYMVSPHTNTTDFFKGAMGQGSFAQEQGRPMVRPVFKDEKQRESFNQFGQAFVKHWDGKADTEEKKRRLTAAKQLTSWSSKDNSMTSLKDTRTSQGQHPVVLVQGHGSPGDQHIYDKNNRDGTHSGDVAKMLDKMDLPGAAEVRANSCYSGTEKNLGKENKYAAIAQDVKRHQADVNLAGDWDKTFAGGLQSGLQGTADSAGNKRNNNVVGYLGPTSKYAEDKVYDFSDKGKLIKQRSMMVTSGKASGTDMSLDKELKMKQSLMARSHSMRNATKPKS